MATKKIDPKNPAKEATKKDDDKATERKTGRAVHRKSSVRRRG